MPLVKVSSIALPGEGFTYVSSQKIKRGSLVTIEFGKKHLRGIVLKSVKRPSFFTKKVLKVLVPQLLTSQQIKLAQVISLYNLTPLGTCLKLFIPPLTKTTLERINFPSIETVSSVKLTIEQKEAVKKITSLRKKKIFLTFRSRFFRKNRSTDKRRSKKR